MLRFFAKTVATDTMRAVAGQLVGAGILMGASGIANIATRSRSSFWSSVDSPITSSVEPSSNNVSIEVNSSGPLEGLCNSLFQRTT